MLGVGCIGVNAFLQVFTYYHWCNHVNYLLMPVRLVCLFILHESLVVPTTKQTRSWWKGIGNNLVFWGCKCIASFFFWGRWLLLLWGSGQLYRVVKEVIVSAILYLKWTPSNVWNMSGCVYGHPTLYLENPEPPTLYLENPKPCKPCNVDR